jgi:hypothetical protein
MYQTVGTIPKPNRAIVERGNAHATLNLLGTLSSP